MAGTKREKPEEQDVIKDNPVEYFGAEEGEEPGPRFIDAGDEEIEDEHGYGRGTTAAG
ncbi:MAG TPA: hypothetical protein VM262_15520 [Acidimicrobiales bacterium]|nr:hypothetical protein [Acidimicrobiales bacterium]